MKRFEIISLSVAMSGLFLPWNLLAASKVLSIDFKGTADPNQIEIHADGPVSVDKQMNSADQQFILDIKDATITRSVAREIDTSSFNSSVVLIRPYQVEGAEKTVRVVVQLKPGSTVTPDVSQEGNLVKVLVAGGGVQSTELKTHAAAPASAETDPVMESAPASNSGGTAALTDYIKARDTRQFSGRPITLQVRDVDVADVFRLIGEASGFNIILADDIKGKLTLSLVEVPWDQALDVVLNTLRLGAERNASILRIMTLDSLAKERATRIEATKAARIMAPRMTRVFPISYAKLSELSKTINDLLNSERSAAASVKVNGVALQDNVVAGTVVPDERTNSLIVFDTSDNIERIKKLIEILDVQTPQVMIEGKVVEASEAFSKQISGNLAIAPNDGKAFASFAGGNPIDQLFGSSSGATGIFSNGGAVSAATAKSGAFGGVLTGPFRLAAILNLGESESKVKVIASPKTVVLNKAQATIVQSTPVLIPVTTTSTSGVTIPATTVQQANLSLDVKPTVTNDGGVLMELTLTRDIPFTLDSGGQAVANRQIKTTVLVESGNTLVLGGFYTIDTTEASSGFPFLRKIPILGWLFGSETSSNRRSELFFFITPQVLNPKKAGISTS